MKGYAGKIAFVDLTTGEVKQTPLAAELAEQFVGGLGLATKLLYDLTTGATEPFSPENALIFATGPFQGLGVPGSGRYVVVAKSPLTGTFGTSTAGSAWGIELKLAGFDALVVRGKAATPVYLWVHDGQVEIRDAAGLWGIDATETLDAVKAAVGVPGASVACIGPAGEREVGCACIMTDGHSAAGRCGLGAVMGSKGLKAVAVKGAGEVEAAAPERLAELNKALMKKIAAAAREGLHALGTPMWVVGAEEGGDLPIKYWAGSRWTEGAQKLGTPSFGEQLKAKPHPCRSCPIGCHRKVEFEAPEGRVEGAGAEYESLGMLGSNCLVDDLIAVSRANELCNRLGLDTISAGSYVAFTMECFERGWLTAQEIGSPARWGDGEFLVKLVGEIGRREGFGARFDGGIRPAAASIGAAASETAVEVRGLDLPAHDPRLYYSLALTYATSPRGACHLHGFSHCGEGGTLIPELGMTEAPLRFAMAGKAEHAALFQDYANTLELLVICMYMHLNGMTMTDTVGLMEAITGHAWTPAELFQAGERTFTLQRLMNLRDGRGASEDRLPRRMFEPATEGARAGKAPADFAEALQAYYRVRGWSEDGAPTAQKLQELGL